MYIHDVHVNLIELTGSTIITSEIFVLQCTWVQNIWWFNDFETLQDWVNQSKENTVSACSLKRLWVCETQNIRSIS